MDDLEVATFGMGCFWCGEVSFAGTVGIASIRVGYMGGTMDDPTYEAVCSGVTDHIEVVEIQFDSSRLNYQRLLELFWTSHNPILTGEGNGDSGSQYRSAIFFHSEEQKVLAEVSKRRVQTAGRFRGCITTLILPASRFWVAEDCHQCYVAKIKGSDPMHKP